MQGVVEPNLQRCRSALIALGVTGLLAACATPAPSSQQQKELAGAISSPAPVQVPDLPVESPEEIALRQLVALQDRLDRVAAPLLVNNPALCKGNARRLLGFTAKTKYSYSDEYLQAAQKLFKLDERLQVTGVLPGSGAARVGVARGDSLIAVDDKALPQGRNAERQAAAILAPLVNGRANVKLTVQRKGNTVVLDVPLTTACAFRVELGNSDAVNAYSDGHRVLVTRGMMRYATSDQDLSYVLARELAHNALRHPVRLRNSATIAGVIDNLIRIKPDLNMITGTAGIKPYSQEMDAAADTIGLYMAARAGYAIERSSVFWQGLASQYPASITNGYTALHPSTEFRIAAIDKAKMDIRAKQSAQKTLLP
ncbi:hypothetical protein GCM10022212_23910 [Actimicrobium antarcticum]|uniref:PDZ domain-containing protein n=2 Tax=Actimicrobium antarcticum TaxID=1051899 RepID=A0ABP7TEY4_9BURK